MRRRTLAALALVPALALGLQGCGSAAGLGGAGKDADDDEKLRKYAQCMRDNGVDMADPEDGRLTVQRSGDPGPGADTKLRAAEKKCRGLLPDGGRGEKAKPADLAKLRAYSVCMRQQGLSEFPDPEPDGSLSIHAGKGSAMDPQNPKFKAAEKVCRKLQPRGGKAEEKGAKG